MASLLWITQVVRETSNNFTLSRVGQNSSHPLLKDPSYTHSYPHHNGFSIFSSFYGFLLGVFARVISLVRCGHQMEENTERLHQSKLQTTSALVISPQSVFHQHPRPRPRHVFALVMHSQVSIQPFAPRQD